MKKEYPHFVRPYSKIEHDGFVTFYMPDEDVRKIKRIFPNGCMEETSIHLFYLELNGRSLNDLPVGEDRTRVVYEHEKEFDKKYMWADYKEFLHWGYRLLIDPNTLKYMVVKGKIWPNEHTKYVLLDKPPERLKKGIKEILEKIEDIRKLHERYFGTQ